MNKNELGKIISRLENGGIDVVSALSEIASRGNVSDTGFARIDHSRYMRCGFPEFVFGEGKTPEQIIRIVSEIKKKSHPVLVTRLAPEKAAEVLKKFPGAEYDELAKTFLIRTKIKKSPPGTVLIVTAGTSDLGVALEAKYTSELCGCRTELIADAGVAGIHRLFAEGKRLKEASVIIAVAGMEGALPSVIGGLVPCPVIAVPTSVGYGASLGGFSAMFAMLNSCANGITVVNIDNGFGAGCAAARILNSRNSTANLF